MLSNTIQAGRLTFISNRSSFVTTATATCMGAMIFIRVQNYKTINLIELKIALRYDFCQKKIFQLKQTTNTMRLRLTILSYK